MKALPALALLILTPLACAQPGSQSAFLKGSDFFQVFSSPELGLSLRYPAAFNKETGARIAAFEHAVFALHPEADPTHTGADPCAPLVLVLGSGLDLPTETIVKGKKPFLTPKGTLTLSEVKRSCLDKDTLDDTTLGILVGQTSRQDGMRPLTRVANHFIQGSTVWTATSAAYGKDKDGKRTPAGGLLLFGSIGAVVNGHMLLWSITANDSDLFNRLVNLSACFDSPTCNAGYSQLLPLELNTHPSPNQTASR